MSMRLSMQATMINRRRGYSSSVLIGVGASEAGVVGQQLVGVGGEAVLTSVHEPDGIPGTRQTGWARGSR